MVYFTSGAISAGLTPDPACADNNNCIAATHAPINQLKIIDSGRQMIDDSPVPSYPLPCLVGGLD